MNDKPAKALAEKRDLLAQGLWTNTSYGWTVQQTRGSWQEGQDGPSGSKRMTPEAILTEVDDLRAIVREIETLIADAKKLLESFRSS